jgi:ArsR family transcriptional regulator
MRKLAKTFKAMSDETRLRILNILLERECCVCEVMQVLDITQSRASRHLITLCDAGFLKFRRQGLWAMYSIDWEGMNKNRIDLVTTVREALMNNQTALSDKRKLSETVKIGMTGCSVSGANSGREN